MSTVPLMTLQSEAASPAMTGLCNGFRERLAGKLKARSTYALADQVVYSFGNMMVAALVSRHCGQRQFGMYILTQRAMDVLIQLSNVFLWAPFTFGLPATPDGKKPGYQGSILALQLVLCGLFSGILWLASRWASGPSRSEYYGVFAPLVLTAGGILFREFTRRMYFAHLRMEEAFWTEVGTVILQVAGIVLLYRSQRLNVFNTLLVLSAGAVVVSLWWVVREWDTWCVSARTAAQDLRENLRLGRWFLGSNMLFMVSSQCNPWVLSALLGSASVGAYSICESVVNIPRVALTSMQNVMGPVIARAHSEGGKSAVRSTVHRLDRGLLFGSAALALVICATGPFIGRLIFKNVPGNARSVLLLLSLNLVVYASTLAQSYGLTAVGRVDTTFYANLIGLVGQVAVCVLLVRSFHVGGAAAAMLIGSVITWIARQLFFQREVCAA